MIRTQAAVAATPIRRRRVLRVPHVRAANRAAVLQLLRPRQRLSRAEIARRTGLSEAAVSRIVAELLREELVVEQGGEDTTGGRPAIPLQLNEYRFQAVGVDIQNWETRLSVGTITGRVLKTRCFRTPSTPERTLQLIEEEGRRYFEEDAQNIRAVGISMRGLINSETGVAELGSDPIWVNVAIKQELEKRLGKPVFVENNVRAAALAEYHYGTLEIQGSHCLLFVKVDEGIGMGIILDGQLYHGPRMAAGELGQVVIADSPGPERHNRPGCVEILAADPATSMRYRQLAGTPTRVNLGNTAEQMKRICHLAMEGDPQARQAILESARYLGIAIANVLWVLDAETVVIDGAITEAWPLVSTAIREQFPEGREFLNFRNLILRPSSLRGEAAITGAVTLPFGSLFSSDEAGRA